MLPPEPKADDPDRERPARVRERARGGADVPGDAQAEEVEQRDAAADGEAGVEHGGRRDHLRPAAREVEEGGEARDGGDGEDGDEEEDGERAEEALEADGDERRDGVPACGGSVGLGGGRRTYSLFSLWVGVSMRYFWRDGDAPSTTNWVAVLESG